MSRRIVRTPAALLWLTLAATGGNSLLAQIPDEVEVTKVAAGLIFPTGLAWSHAGFLLIADGQKPGIYRLAAGRRSKFASPDANGGEGLVYDNQSRLYICEPAARRLVRVDKKGKEEILVDAFDGKKLNSPGDVTVRRDGNVYFTDPAFAGAIDRRELAFNGVFHVSLKGKVEAIAKWETRPDGVALSSDGKKLFVADADRHAVVIFNLDSKGGAANPRDFVTGIDGVPAGLCTDAAGRLYVSARGLAVYTPEGKLLRTFLSTMRVTNCAFGDTDLESLYVTAPQEVYKIKIGVKGSLQY